MKPPPDYQQELVWTPGLRRQYWQHLKAEGIPDKQQPYYGLRVQQYIQATGSGRLADIINSDVQQIIHKLCVKHGLSDWQLDQLIDAIRILYKKVLKVEQCFPVEMSPLSSEISIQNSTHTTTAREYTPNEQLYLKTRRSSSRYSNIRNDNKDIIVGLATEIRVRGFAYRTEDAYASEGFKARSAFITKQSTLSSLQHLLLTQCKLDALAIG